MSEINIDYINEQLDLLDDTKSQIKQAIIDKGQDIEDSDTFNSFAEKIAEIQTKRNTADVPIWSSYTGINAIDNTLLNTINNETEVVFSLHMAMSRIDDFSTSRSTSQPVVGDFCVISNVTFSDGTYIVLGYFSSIDSQYVATSRVEGKVIILDGINPTKFGNAQNIRSGQIATGTSILGIQGTYTSDASAGNYDIVSGQTAYVNGQKRMGTIKSIGNLTNNEQRYIMFDLSNYGDPNNSYIGVGFNPSLVGSIDRYYVQKSYDGLAQIAHARVDGATNLLPENIKDGVKVLGVTGTLEAGPISQEDYDECLDIANNILGE